MTDQTSFIPSASGPRQPAYWRPPTTSVPANNGWGQPGVLWTSRPVPPVQSGPLSVPPASVETGGRRPPERRIRMILIVLLATMTAAACTFGALYVNASSAAATAITEAKTDTASATAARQKAEDRAATAEDERDEAKTAAQGLQTCRQASRDLLVALGGNADDPATTDALRRMADSCA